MANDPHDSSSRKRAAGDAGLNSTHSMRAAKKRATQVVRHRLLHQQDVELKPWLASHDHEAIREILERSLALALGVVGFEYCDPVALNSFRAMVEEYMAHFLRAVQKSMNSARRRQPVPQDFIYALSQNNLTLSSLLPHLDPPVTDPRNGKGPLLSSKREIMPRLGVAEVEPSAFENKGELALLDTILSGSERRVRPEIIPTSFPPLPPRHTYKAQDVLPPRESDPQKVRERATEEGRLGEEALRRFTAKAAEIKAAQATAIAAKQQRESSFTQRADEMWKTLMHGISIPQTNGDADMLGENPMLQSATGNATAMLSGPVNAETRHWRKAPKRIAEKG